MINSFKLKGPLPSNEIPLPFQANFLKRDYWDFPFAELKTAEATYICL